MKQPAARLITLGLLLNGPIAISNETSFCPIEKHQIIREIINYHPHLYFLEKDLETDNSVQNIDSIFEQLLNELNLEIEFEFRDFLMADNGTQGW